MPLWIWGICGGAFLCIVAAGALLHRSASTPYALPATARPSAPSQALRQIASPTPPPRQPAAVPATAAVDKIDRAIDTEIAAARAATQNAVRPAAAPLPPFCQTLVYGVIGTDVTAEELEAAYDGAAEAGAAVLVLDIDSPGGSVPELFKMIEAIRNHRSTRTIAYVRRSGLSAAAILALCCSEIYMNPDATLGAAAIVGGPADPAMSAKLASANLASERSAVERAGHSPLLVIAMADVRAEVSVQRHADGSASLVAGHPPGSEWLKHDGSLLTLTAGEARDLGVAKAIVETWEFRRAADLGDRSDKAQEAANKATWAREARRSSR